MKNYLFVSDIHGRDLALEAKLLKTAEKENPKGVFFLGDIVGTDLLDQLQKLFYNGVYNHMKKLLKINPNPTDKEILNFSTENGKTLINGIEDLWNFLYHIYPIELVNKANYARELSSYTHFGHFCSNLKEKIIDTLRKDMIKNAEKIYQIMEKFTKIGSAVIIVEGNWDARNPLDFEIGPECIAKPIDRRPFVYKKFIESKNNKNIFYFDTVATIETKEEIFSIWPFDSVINLVNKPEIKKTKKKVILISHAQADWKSIKGETPMTSEGQKINDNMKIIIDAIKPNFIVHGHLHDVINNPVGYRYGEIPVFYLPLRTCRFIDF